MAKVTDNELRELKALILSNQQVLDARLTSMETRLTSIETRLTSVETGQIEIKERLVGIESSMGEWRSSIQKIPDLAEKVGELKNWRQILIITITATVSSFIGWLIRGGNFKP